eukprot:gene428-510_t
MTELAEALKQRFTVVLMDRRGHGASGAQGDNYSMDKETDDLAAVAKETGARLIFAHSFGGLVTLETQLRYPNTFQTMVLYEPGVSIKGLSMPWEWVSDYQACLAADNRRGAFNVFVKAAGHAPPLAAMPYWLSNVILRMAVRGEHWEEINSSLEVNLLEHLEIQKIESSSPSRYSGISSTTTTHILIGSISPPFLHQVVDQLQSTIPNTTSHVLANLTHISPNNHNAAQLVANNILSLF